MEHSPNALFGIDANKMDIQGPPYVVPEAPKVIEATEEAAMKFTHLLPFVKKFCAVMSAKSQARVHHAMAEFPLGASKPKLLDDNERQLFHLLQELQGYKATVINDIMKKNYDLEQLKQKALMPETDIKDEHGSKEI